jgi:2-haloacid dehalogenase
MILRSAARAAAERFGFTPTGSEITCLEDSLPHWRPFPDTVPALRALARRFRLGIISNIDNDLFAATAAALEVEFEWVITAQDVGSYKPCRRNFERAVERIALSRSRILHVAQSLYHDVAPAGATGLTTVWVNRRGERGGFGATPASEASPDVAVRTLGELAALIEAERGCEPSSHGF